MKGFTISLLGQLQDICVPNRCEAVCQLASLSGDTFGTYLLALYFLIGHFIFLGHFIVLHPFHLKKHTSLNWDYQYYWWRVWPRL